MIFLDFLSILLKKTWTGFIWFEVVECILPSSLSWKVVHGILGRKLKLLNLKSLLLNSLFFYIQVKCYIQTCVLRTDPILMRYACAYGHQAGRHTRSAASYSNSHLIPALLKFTYTWIFHVIHSFIFGWTNPPPIPQIKPPLKRKKFLYVCMSLTNSYTNFRQIFRVQGQELPLKRHLIASTLSEKFWRALDIYKYLMLTYYYLLEIKIVDYILNEMKT